MPGAVFARAWIGRRVGNSSVTWEAPILNGADVSADLSDGSASLAEIGVVVAPATTPPPPNVNTDTLVLLEISCPEDRANTDPATQLGTAIGIGQKPPADPAEIAALVATDNNLGLFFLTAP